MKYVVVGGGIAGVCCVEELCRLCPEDEVLLLTNTTRLKGVSNLKRASSNIEEFQVVDKDLGSLPFSNLETLQATVTSLDANRRQLQLADGGSVAFDKLCICTGASPRRVAEGPYVVVLRDQDSVEDLSRRLESTRRIVLVGNGGIALELAHALQSVEVVWALKHGHIGDAFFDYDAAGFLKTELERGQSANLERAADPSQEHKQHGTGLVRQHLHASASIGMHKGLSCGGYGHAVGPQWASALPVGPRDKQIHIQTDCEVERVVSDSSAGWPITVHLTNGTAHDADLMISAVGVAPNSDWADGVLPLAEDDRGILVDRNMETSCSGVFAAGDACSVRWTDSAPHWFQMRLWTQAKVMGSYAAHCMAGTQDSAGVSFNFELFTHVTRFLSKKVVLLGLYNGQKVPEQDAHDLVSYTRSTEGCNSTFVRVLLLRGRMIGAVLIGETDLEETFENLILDQLDLSSYGPALLDPDVEIDHIFD